MGLPAAPGHAGGMKRGLWIIPIGVCLLMQPHDARAQATPDDPMLAAPDQSDQGTAAPPGGEGPAQDPLAATAEQAGIDPEGRDRLFPLGGRRAIARGYRIPEPWGLGALVIWNDVRFRSRDLSVAVRKGRDPDADAALVPLPAVTTDRLESDTRMTGLKGDLWLFPGVNIFASVGKVKGTNSIDVDVDLDELVPFPICRPAKPCGTIRLPIETKVNNSTVTLGTILVYGTERWFVLGTIAKTISVSSKQRSDVRSTNLALRGGPRFQLDDDMYFAPYVGANYFDLKTRVRGVVASGPVFEDGEAIHLRYEIDMAASHPWAGAAGFNLEVNRHLTVQGEIQLGAESTRILASAGIRF